MIPDPGHRSPQAAVRPSWCWTVPSTPLGDRDPGRRFRFPFILLNLAFSTQAAYAAPLILLAGNRSAARDRMTLEYTAAEADKEEQQNVDILAGISRLEEASHELLLRVVVMEGTIIANQDRLMEKLPSLRGTLVDPDAPPGPTAR